MRTTPQSKEMVMASLLRLTAFSSVLVLLSTGCPATREDSDVCRERLFFPSGMAVSPDESVLFVSNSNAELRYNAGSVSVIDLDTIDTLIDNWVQNGEAPGSCSRDLIVPGALACEERAAMLLDGGVKIGNFSTALSVQELASGDLRLFVAVRGDPSITWIDYSSSARELSCTEDNAEVFPLCGSDNRLLHLRGDLELPELVGEPFGMYVDSASGYVLVTHLALGAVTLIDSPFDAVSGDPDRRPRLVDTVEGLFDINTSTGVRAALGVAGRQPGTENDLIYVTSRSEDRVQMMSVYRGGVEPVLAVGEYFFMEGVAPSNDARGIAFNEDGSRLHIVNRLPAFMHVFDTEDGPDGFPKNQFLGGVELCNEASNIEVADLGRGDRAYITCFPNGQIWVADPRTQVIDSIIDVGRGPHAISLAKDRGRLYIANFLEHTIAVVDIRPGSPTENRVVLRLGGLVDQNANCEDL